jgi:hypothetical protein
MFTGVSKRLSQVAAICVLLCMIPSCTTNDNLCRCLPAEQCHRCTPQIGCPPKQLGVKCKICDSFNRSTGGGNP